MCLQLLPASAAAFAPSASSVIVMFESGKPEQWLTLPLKTVNRVKRPLNSAMQHRGFLTELLSKENAVWILASLMLPKAPQADLREDDNPLIEAIFNYQLMHIEAYVVYVDMVLRNEVGFKLNKDTIESLIEYHKDVHCIDAMANTHDWTEKEQQAKKLHEDFVQAVNEFVYRTHVSALEGLEEEGGELLNGKSEEVKTQLLSLMKPLLPPPTPPPRAVEIIRQQPQPSTQESLIEVLDYLYNPVAPKAVNTCIQT